MPGVVPMLLVNYWELSSNQEYRPYQYQHSKTNIFRKYKRIVKLMEEVSCLVRSEIPLLENNQVNKYEDEDWIYF